MAQDWIRQMVNFILQEAHEKANEIRVKVRCRCSIAMIIKAHVYRSQTLTQS